MRRLLGAVVLVLWLGAESMAQFSCPGGVCYVPETSSNVRASVRSRTRSGPGGGGLLGGLGRLLAGRRGGAGVSSSGSAYGSYGASGAFSGAPQLFAQAETFGGGGSCYSSGGGAPMAYSPYAAPPQYSAPPMYSAPPQYSAPPPVIYSTPQTFLDDGLSARRSSSTRIVSITVLPAYTVSRSLARSRAQVVGTPAPRASVRGRLATVPPERRPTAVAVRPDPPVEQMAGGRP